MFHPKINRFPVYEPISHFISFVHYFRPYSFSIAIFNYLSHRECLTHNYRRHTLCAVFIGCCASLSLARVHVSTNPLEGCVRSFNENVQLCAGYVWYVTRHFIWRYRQKKMWFNLSTLVLQGLYRF